MLTIYGCKSRLAKISITLSASLRVLRTTSADELALSRSVNSSQDHFMLVLIADRSYSTRLSLAKCSRLLATGIISVIDPGLNP